MIPLSWKLIAAAVVVAIIGGLITVQHFTQKKLNATRHELASANATIEAERKARAHELKIAKEASDGYQAELRRIRAEPAIGSVRICPARRVPAATSAASGPDATGAGRFEEAVAGDSEPVDVGPALDSYGTDCEATAAQLTALQGWVMAR